MKKITHIGVYQIYKDRLFDNVNSYDEMNKAIKKYGGVIKTEADTKKYTDNTGRAWEIFNMYFILRYLNIPKLGITNIKDTSDHPFNPGYDFNFTDFSGKRGHIQSKWRDNPLHEFGRQDMSSNCQAAYLNNVSRDNNILFINFDDNVNLFHYEYTEARTAHRVFGRKTQEEDYILHDPKFWDDFRACIEYSAQNYFVDPHKLRDIQEWILYGNKEKGFLGTRAVIDSLYHKGRVEAATASGKSLCIYHNILDAFKYKRDIAVVVIPWLSLIDQTFKDFYMNKMFGYDDKNGNIYNPHNTTCVIVRSKGEVKCNHNITHPFQSLVPEHIVGKIISDVNLGKKVVVIITMASYRDKYMNPKDKNGDPTTGILDMLFERGIKKEQIIEIIDEYHNIIPSSGDRKNHLERAEYLMTYSDRNSGTIFYSASNKRGDIVDSFDEEQFGPLLCRVTREDLRIRGYVCPKLLFKFLVVKPLTLSAEAKRNAARKGLDIDKAQSEAAGVVIAFNDLLQYYKQPNLITFGDHVAACRQIKEDTEMAKFLPDINLHFMDADTPTDSREEIKTTLDTTGNNILNQHSVAKEGVNIPNLHGGLIDRGMDAKTAQQAIGRSDRAMYSDTVKFMNGEISLDSPEGWEKYWNVIYLLVDDNDLSFAKRLKDIVRYLLLNGIPKNEWAISVIDDEERGGKGEHFTDADISLPTNCGFSTKQLDKMIADTIVIVQQELIDESIGKNTIDVYAELEKIADDEETAKERLKYDSMDEDTWYKFITTLPE
jgi:superfamily II DNA or RNA helicase